MVTIDAFGVYTAGIRGLFEYIYKADTLQLLPHLPDSITALEQNFGIRWGSYRLWISATGVRSSGIAAVEVDGKPLAAPHTWNATAITLAFSGLPPLSAAAAAAVESDVLTSADNITIKIIFKKQTTHTHDDVPQQASPAAVSLSPLAVPLNCSAVGLSAAEVAQVETFLQSAAAKGLRASVVCALGQSALDFAAGHTARCAGLNGGTVPSLSDPKGNGASLSDMLTASTSLFIGMTNLLTEYEHYTDPAALQLSTLWKKADAKVGHRPLKTSDDFAFASAERAIGLAAAEPCTAAGQCTDNTGHVWDLSAVSSWDLSARRPAVVSTP